MTQQLQHRPTSLSGLSLRISQVLTAATAVIGIAGGLLKFRADKIYLVSLLWLDLAPIGCLIAIILTMGALIAGSVEDSTPEYRQRERLRALSGILLALLTFVLAHVLGWWSVTRG